MRKLGIGPTARTIGLPAFGAATFATDLQLQHSGVSRADHSDARAAVSGDALAHELLGCQAIGMAAKDDAACEAAWAEKRRRFFAPLSGARSLPPSPDARPPR
jgi:conjugative transfer region protein TrbK